MPDSDPYAVIPPANEAEAAELKAIADGLSAMSISLMATESEHDWRKLPITQFSLDIGYQRCGDRVELKCWGDSADSGMVRFWRSLPMWEPEPFDPSTTVALDPREVGRLLREMHPDSLSRGESQ